MSRSLWKCLFFCCLLPQTSHASSFYNDECLKSYYDANHFKSKESPSIEDTIRVALKKSASKSAFLKTLHNNKKTKDFFKNYTLMHNSASEQKENVSAAYPRIISYLGKIMMAFTGHPKPKDLANDKNIEFIEYNEKENKFDFYLASFNSKPPQLITNPEACFQCHTSHMPIWDSYPLWPGAYRGSQEYLEYLASDQNKEANPEALPEEYKLLTTTGLNLNSQDFGFYVGLLNYKKFSEDLKTHKKYAKYKYLILASIMGCSNLNEFSGSDEFKNINFEEKDREMIRYLIDKNNANLKSFYQRSYKKEVSSESQSEYFDAYTYATLTPILSKLGLHIEDYSLSKKNSKKAYSGLGAGFGGITLLSCFLKDSFKELNDELQTIFKEYSGFFDVLSDHNNLQAKMVKEIRIFEKHSDIIKDVPAGDSVEKSNLNASLAMALEKHNNLCRKLAAVSKRPTP